MLPTHLLPIAAAEARKYLGATSPNPPVGAVAVDASGKVLAVAAHQRAGEDHAEAALLKICQEQNLLPQIHTLHVTLEPCNHHGRTPPCTEAIIASGTKRVVIGARDPNPKVKGGGAERLREAGIDVFIADDPECQHLIHAFAYKATNNRSWITIKRALDKNGSMIPPAGQKTFTSKDSLILAHQLRKKADAIITGSGTILADNPLFTVRHVPDYPGKKRILAILDRQKRVPSSYLEAATERGFEVIIYDNLEKAIDDLQKRDVQDILVEAGPSISEAILNYPFWTMSVTITSGDKDKVNIAFNPDVKIPFDAKQFRREWFLPA